MRAAMATSNLAATQLFKSTNNRKAREESEIRWEEAIPAFIPGHGVHPPLHGHGASFAASFKGRRQSFSGYRQNSNTKIAAPDHGPHSHGAHFHRVQSHGVQSHVLYPTSSHHGPAHMTMPSRKRLRSSKLLDLAKEEICLDSMRKLFRLLDEDGGGTVDCQELKKGMEMLGFEEVSDPVVLDRLMREIDEDKTGTIEENEFLAYFSHESRASLREKLRSWCLDRTHILATRYRSDGKPEVQVAEISEQSIGSWIEEASSKNKGYNYWLDVTGYSRATFTAMAEALGFCHDDFAQLLVSKMPECSAVQGKKGNGCSFIVPSAKLSLNPVPLRSGTNFKRCLPGPVRKFLDILLGDPDIGIPSYLSSRRLAGKRDIAGITISLEQAAIFVANESMVLTFRNPISDYDANQLQLAVSVRHPFPSASPVWRTHCSTRTLTRSTTVGMIEQAWVMGESQKLKSSTVAPGAGSPFAQENSAVRLQFEWLRGKLAEQCPSTSLAADHDVKILAVLLVDQLLTSNYVIRDRIQDWEELVEASIRGVENSASTHLEAMRSLLDRFIDHLEPLAKMLSPAGWDAEEEGSKEKGSKEKKSQEKGDGDEEEGENKPKEERKSQKRKGSKSWEEEEGEKKSEGERKPQKRKGAMGNHAPPMVIIPVNGVAVPEEADDDFSNSRTSRRTKGESSKGEKSPLTVPKRTDTGTLRGSKGKGSPLTSISPRKQSLSSSVDGDKLSSSFDVPARKGSLLPRVAPEESPENIPDLWGDDPAETSTTSGKHHLQLNPLPAILKPISPRASKAPKVEMDAVVAQGEEVGWGGETAKAARVSLRELFKEQLDDFEEISTDVECLVEGSLARHERVDNLTRRLNNSKQDMINRTLYALTLVTAIATPVTICTGIYGMNFEDMPELDPRIPGFEQYGYSFFWKLITTVVCSMVFFLFRLGLFKTLF